MKKRLQIQQALSNWKPDGLTFLSGVLIVLAFPPWNLWPLIWVALIPWFEAIQRASSLRKALVQGVWLSYFMTIGGFYWVAFVLQEFGNLPWIVSLLGLQLFALFGQPQFFIFAYFLKKRPHSTFLGFSILLTFLYTGIDWAAPKMFLDTLGHSFYQAKHLRQLADLTGPFGLTALIFFVNDSLWQQYQNWKKTKRLTLHRQAVASLVSVITIWTYGLYRNHEISEALSHTENRFQAAAIQANIGDFDKIAAEQGIVGAANQVVEKYIQLSNQALQLKPKPDVLIWPETSYPSAFGNPLTRTERLLDEQVNLYSRSISVPLLFGGYDHRNGKDFNTFFFLAPSGGRQIYHKSILLLFGEYIPGAETFDFIKKAFPQVGNFGRGDGPEVLTLETQRENLKGSLGDVKVGPIICYEVLFPSFVIEAARQGSQFILNITNDSWFGKWGEPHLHLALSTFRSIETRLPMLRSTNTGISALILPNGEISKMTSIGVEEILNVSVPIVNFPSTLMKKWGDWFGVTVLILSAIALLACKKYRRIYFHTGNIIE